MDKGSEQKDKEENGLKRRFTGKCKGGKEVTIKKLKKTEPRSEFRAGRTIGKATENTRKRGST